MGDRVFERVYFRRYMFLYTYWMDMKPDRDGHYWGNMPGPAENERIALRRAEYCVMRL